MEQGLSFTAIIAPHPAEQEEGAWEGRRDFYSAHRVWLGCLRGVDWLHEAAEETFLPSGAWMSVDSERQSSHIGASGEVATVVLMLMGAGALNFLRKFSEGFAQRLGEVTADNVLEWARRRGRERQTPHDGPPDFTHLEPASLSEAMRRELASIMDVPVERIEIVSAERRETLALLAAYRDKQTGREYRAEVVTDAVSFTQLGGPEVKKGSRHLGRPRMQ
jgi:hypothetical protein